jgi:hypothetical protein
MHNHRQCTWNALIASLVRRHRISAATTPFLPVAAFWLLLIDFLTLLTMVLLKFTDAGCLRVDDQLEVSREICACPCAL